jgi:hypothetical protein
MDRAYQALTGREIAQIIDALTRKASAAAAELQACSERVSWPSARVTVTVEVVSPDNQQPIKLQLVEGPTAAPDHMREIFGLPIPVLTKSNVGIVETRRGGKAPKAKGVTPNE